MGIVIRQLGEGDIEALDPTLRAAYGVTFSRSAELRRNLAIQPDGWIIAERNSEPVGIVGVTRYDSFAYVGLMAVNPNAQRQGIGRMLMEHLIARCEERGYPTLRLDATPAGAPLYRSVGFVDDGTAALYELAHPVATAGQPGVGPMQPADLPELLALDTPIFGADRGRVLSRLLAELPGRAFVARDAAGALGGFLFAQPSTLGPWVAHTPQIAGALLDTALAQGLIERPRVLVASTQPHAAAILAARGFALQRSLQHMRRGAAGAWGQPQHRYGQTSFALG
jgi:predicted N-acetyltransferase YhbS